MHKLHGAFAMLALTALASCNVPLTYDYIYPMAIATPGEPISEEIRTAAPGELLFSQRVARAGFLRLENTVVPAERVWTGMVTYFPRMEAGLTVYPALRVGKGGRYVACSVEAVTTHQGGLGPAQNFPICFELADSAVVLVRPGEPAPDKATAIGGSLWLLDGAQSHSGFVYAPGGEYAQGWEGANFTLTEPARLSVATTQPSDTSGSPIRIGLRYMSDGAGARLESIYISGEQHLRLQRDPVQILPGDTYPRVVETGGAVVELLAIRDNVLAYRVRRNFPSDRFVISNLPG
jgi:hypothetical protein